VKLAVTTPLAVVVEAGDVAHLRAEDASGAFGILPGHADFLTALAVSVASWRDANGAEREAVVGDDLRRLETEVLATFRRSIEQERSAHTDAQRLYLAAIRQICRFLKHERAPAIPGAPGVEADGSEA
jgi:F-type H+-transporting ATPase subunit epsilon